MEENSVCSNKANPHTTVPALFWEFVWGVVMLMNWRHIDKKEKAGWMDIFPLQSPILALSAAGFLFVGYERPSRTPPASGLDVCLRTHLESSAVGFGSIASSSSTLSVIATIAVIACAILAMSRTLRPQNHERQHAFTRRIFVAAVVVFALAICSGHAGATTLTQQESPTRMTDRMLVTLEIRYTLPEAGEVYLVWGINGWDVTPDELRPAGTELRPAGPKDAKLMHTPMVRDGDIFVVKVAVLAGTTIDYGFLITKSRGPLEIAKPIWDGHERFSHSVTADGRIDVNAGVDFTKRRRIVAELAHELFHDRPSLFIALTAALAVGIGLLYIPSSTDRRTALVVLAGLAFMGLVFRLSTAAPPGRLHDIPPRFIGDEAGYNALAEGLLNGRFFESPETTPVYPLFLAAVYLIFDRSYPAVLYVQAFIGAATIPLTYSLARHFTSRKESLLAGALIAWNPILISHVGLLYMEALYTLLLLLTILCLLWALKIPAIGSYASLGVLFAVATLCRAGTALLLSVLPFLMPRKWRIQRRAVLCLVCSAAMLAVIAPWSYHNYRTHRTLLPLAVTRTILWHGSPEFYHLMQKKPNAVLAVWEEELNPARNGGHEPLTIEGDRYFIKRALESIRSEPATYLLYSVKKPIYFWIGHPAADWEWPFNYDALRAYYSPVHAVMTIATRLALILCAVTSLVVLRYRIREFAPLLAVCGYFLLLHTVTFPNARYGEPLYPILAVLVATAAGQLSKSRGPSPASMRAELAGQSSVSGKL